MASAQSSAAVRIKKILYLTDFSEPSEAALPFVLAIARKYGAKIYALHVLLPTVQLYTDSSRAGEALAAEEERAQAEMQRLDSQLLDLAHEIVVERNSTIWPPVERTLREAKIELIVLGTHGRTGAQKLMMGSVAEEIFRRSTVPVVTIGPAVRTSAHGGARFHRVLFATDFTSESTTAAPYAVSLAQENQARLILLHIMPKPRQQSSEGDAIFEISVAEAIHQLYAAVPQPSELFCPPEVLVDYGRPADRIVAVAKDRAADLIVLGVRSESGHLGAAVHLERTTAHNIVARAPCPVLTVRGERVP